ncbi:gliding motility protein GldL [Pontibacter sp. G13]|uniref:type IX secretion system motor protein PorL/GldL n=1 Tax=Pontibacter sp. G13 TaxID=3074898 RepID=UPI00288A4643|nr:gliding motility protein GldL [Pontibacter sp. G13]WNJ16242.1 gliding motility protein GldL [Pontibacter sp. G13]
MAKKKGFLKSRAGKVVLNFIYGAAAAVVIVGALFKILHLEGASEMLIVGMGVEALVFLISAFDPPADDYEWERVYPALVSDSYEPADTWEPTELPKLDGKVFDDLSTTLTGLNDNVGKLSTVADAASATNDYASKIKEASSKIESLNNSYSVAVDSMSGFANAATDAQAYHEQVQTITKNLSSLNSIYELELQDAKTHLKSLNQFYGSMTEAMASMAEASKDAESYKKGMAELNTNLQKLNGVYGNMLNAMAGGAR